MTDILIGLLLAYSFVGAVVGVQYFIVEKHLADVSGIKGHNIYNKPYWFSAIVFILTGPLFWVTILAGYMFLMVMWLVTIVAVAPMLLWDKFVTKE